MENQKPFEDEISQDTRWWHLNAERGKAIIMFLIAFVLLGAIVTQVIVNQTLLEVKESAAASKKFYNEQGITGAQNLITSLTNMAQSGDRAMQKFETVAGDIQEISNGVKSEHLPETFKRLNRGLDGINQTITRTDESLNGPEGVLPGLRKIEDTANTQIDNAGQELTARLKQLGNIMQIAERDLPRITGPLIETGNEVLLIVKDEKTKAAVADFYKGVGNVQIVTEQAAKAMTSFAHIVDGVDKKVNPAPPKGFWGKTKAYTMKTLGILQGVGRVTYVFGLTP
jgi:hypothetical protein